MKRTVRLLMTETSAELCQLCREELPGQGIEVDVCACNGPLAYHKLVRKKPDAMLLDVFMPGMDALALVAQYNGAHPGHATRFYAIGTFKNDMLEKELLENGFCFYFLKPVDVHALARRVRRPFVPQTAPPLPLCDEDIVQEMLKNIGVPAHLKGHRYLQEAILWVDRKPDILGAMTKKLYPGVADACATTPTRVERAIRNAIEIAWARGDMDVIEAYFGATVLSHRGKPTNSECIATLANRLAKERRQGG